MEQDNKIKCIECGISIYGIDPKLEDLTYDEQLCNGCYEELGIVKSFTYLCITLNN